MFKKATKFGSVLFVILVICFISFDVLSFGESENNSSDNATDITLSKEATDFLYSENDINWYKFNTNKKHFIFAFSLTEDTNIDTINLGWNISIYKADNTKIFSMSSVTANRISPKLPYSGEILIKIEASNKASTQNAPIFCPYNIKITEFTDKYYENESNDKSNTANNISVGYSYSGALQSTDDTDWYKFKATKDYFVVNFNINNKSDIETINDGFNISLYKNNSSTPIFEYKNVTSKCSSYKLPFVGEFLIKIEAYNKISGFSPDFCDYDIKITEMSDIYFESETNGVISLANTVKYDKSYTGALQFCDDIDWYKINSSCINSISFKINKSTAVDKVGTGWKITVYGSDLKTKLASVYAKEDTVISNVFSNNGVIYIKVEAKNKNENKAPKNCYYDIKISHKTHSYKNVLTKATLKNNGGIVNTCKYCGHKKSIVKTYYYPKTIKLSKTTYIYDGKLKTPCVTVLDSKGKKIAKSNYTVTQSKTRNRIGVHNVTIKFKGNFTGTKILQFKVLPGSTTLSLKASGKKVVCSWKKLGGVSGYELYYSTKKNSGYKKVTVTKKLTATKNNLTKGKRYYFRVRAYKKVGKKYYYGAWSTKYIKAK